MRRIVSVLVIVAACGGPQIPTHNGYKTDKAKPWKKPKLLAFDDKLELKTEGDLSYPDMRRAKWFALTLPANGELALRLEITPPGDATNDDFDLGLEVLDPGYRSISKSDLEDSDAHELVKTKTLVDLLPGTYLIHLYLQGRMDTADFVFHASFKPTPPAETKSDFPTQVLFVPPLPMVSLNDDAPKNYKPQVVISHTHHVGQPVTHTVTPVAAPTPVALAARIINLNVGSGGTQITIGRGTSNGAAAGMKGKITGLANGSFSVASCSDRACIAVVSATPEQIKASGGNVVLTP